MINNLNKSNSIHNYNILNSPRSSLLNTSSSYQNYSSNLKNNNCIQNEIIHLILEDCVKEWFPIIKNDECTQNSNTNNKLLKLNKYYKGINSDKFPLEKLYRTDRNVSSLNEDNEDDLFYSSNIYKNILNEKCKNDFENQIENQIEKKNEKDNYEDKEIYFHVTDEYEITEKQKDLEKNKKQEYNKGKIKDMKNEQINYDKYIKEIEMKIKKERSRSKELEKHKSKELEKYKTKEFERNKTKDFEKNQSKEFEINKSKEFEINKSKEFERNKTKEIEINKSKENERNKTKEIEKKLNVYKHVHHHLNNDDNKYQNIEKENINEVNRNTDINKEINKNIYEKNTKINENYKISTIENKNSKEIKVKTEQYEDNTSINDILEKLKREELKEKNRNMDKYSAVYMNICKKVLKKNENDFLVENNLNIEELKNEKKKIKEILKLFDKLFYYHFQFVPNKFYKENLRPIYSYYQNLKQNITQEQDKINKTKNSTSFNNQNKNHSNEFNVNIKSTNSFGSMKSIDKSVDCENIIKDINIAKILQDGEINKDISYLKDDYKYIYKELVTLQNYLAKKKYYKNIIFNYQKQFLQENNRCVKTYRDLYPIEKEFKMYNQIKKDILELIKIINAKYKKYYLKQYV